MTIRQGNGLCYVCGRGFEEDEDLFLHIIIHPGRSYAEYERARAIVEERTMKEIELFAKSSETH